MRQKRLMWWLSTLAVFSIGLSGCSKPCDTTAECGEDGMCVAARCETLSCDKTIFAVDPQTGECTPLSGCYLTDDQRAWKSCASDPCQGLDENGCIADARCQPAYSNPKVEPKRTGAVGDVAAVGCGGDVFSPPSDPGRPDGQVAAPGVNNGETPKHPSKDSGCSGLIDNSARVYSGCRAAPKIEPRRACEELTTADCRTRRDCSTTPPSGKGETPIAVPTPSPGPSGQPIGEDAPPRGQCFSRFPTPATSCGFASATSCLLSSACQPIGTRCYCPPGGKCDCDGGAFLGCETNDRLRRCHKDADCAADERCDNDEACIAPRTFMSAPSGPEPVPGTASCTGACVKKGCAGMGEKMCNDHPECDAGSYATVCRPKPYCAGGGGDPLPPDANFVPGGSACGCDSEFQGCGQAAPLSDLRPERSLLVRDPEIIDDPAFRLDAVFGKLAPAGKLDDFTAALLKQVGAKKTLGNGALAAQRTGYTAFVSELRPDSAGVAQRLAGLLHITALVNRIDLAKPGDCGEARLTYALTSAYTDGNQRMTLIVELRVPDDGMGCRSVAQRWGELSLVDDMAERRTRLLAIYDELLKPERLGQIRTNEFLNRTGREPWELREFHLKDGLPELSPVAQTPDKSFLKSAELLAWLKANATQLHAGNAVIPAQYLAASSTEDGGRLRLLTSDATLQQAEKDMNAQTCAGCHLTETSSPFVHIGERLGKRVGGSAGYLPSGRAVIDTFLKKELITRAKNLRDILNGTPTSLRSLEPTGLARVH